MWSLGKVKSPVSVDGAPALEEAAGSSMRLLAATALVSGNVQSFGSA